jgi:hypothetical protein
MTSTAPATPTDPADLDAALIADAATRLSILRRLGDLGMRLAEEIVERAVNSPYHPEPRHEPGRAFAAISRAVRLTLALQVNMEDRLVALRKGETPTAGRPGRARVGRPADATRDDRPDDPPEPPDSSRENLRERESERFDELLSGPFEDCVAAIRADLGLEAGESIPSDAEGVESAIRNVLAKASAPPEAPSLAVPATATALTRVLTPHPADSG